MLCSGREREGSRAREISCAAGGEMAEAAGSSDNRQSTRKSHDKEVIQL